MTVQNCGHDVTFDSRPEQVLPIDAGAPTLVAAAGGADQAALQGVPQLTTNTDIPSIEEIIAQQADLVVSNGAEDAAALAAVGIKQLVTSGRCRGADGKVSASGTFDEVFADIELYGRILGTQDAATATVADLRRRVTAGRNSSRPARRGARRPSSTRVAASCSAATAG
ncbi:MAG: hypothetical protein ACRDRH_05920 [Pseudonocardia sp.]